MFGSRADLNPSCTYNRILLHLVVGSIPVVVAQLHQDRAARVCHKSAGHILHGGTICLDALDVSACGMLRHALVHRPCVELRARTMYVLHTSMSQTQQV
jgi:hypothetical protein